MTGTDAAGTGSDAAGTGADAAGTGADAAGTASARLAAALEGRAAAFDGRVGYRFAHLGSGEVVERNADESFPTASAIKLPLLTAFHLFVARGGCRWDDTVELTADDIAPGSGILGDLELPRRLGYRDAAWLMICVSDNSATNVILRAMGLETANRLIAETAGPGIVIDKHAGPPPGRASVSMGHATPRALGRYLDALAADTLPGAAETLAVARRQTSGGGIPRYLPFERDDQSRLAIAHKDGSLAGVRTDIGVVTTPTTAATMAIMVADAADTSDVFESAPEVLVGRLARDAYDAWFAAGPGRGRMGR